MKRLQGEPTTQMALTPSQSNLLKGFETEQNQHKSCFSVNFHLRKLPVGPFEERKEKEKRALQFYPKWLETLCSLFMSEVRTVEIKGQHSSLCIL